MQREQDSQHENWTVSKDIYHLSSASAVPQLVTFDQYPEGPGSDTKCIHMFHLITELD